MIFNSASFAAFFLIVYCGYVALKPRYMQQNVLLLVASYVFYGFWDWRFPCLMGVTTIIDYGCCQLMRQQPSRRRIFLSVSLITNLGVLFLFKYFDFFQNNVLDALKFFGVDSAPILTGIILPVGISFYTFQRMTFVIDVYKGSIKTEVPFLVFALFVSFFPLLLSGPIERASSLLPQLLKPRSITSENIETGVWLIVWGLFKKVYVADNLALLVNPVFSNGWTGTGAEVLCGVYAYAFQIYCDFSGYSDVARGLALVLGFNVMNNFNIPYLAHNPSEFWRRWHISLSTWIRDYVYIPLGGNRHGTWCTIRNIFVAMLLVGLWHGAAWTFIFWGAYHGGLLAAHRLYVTYKSPEKPPSLPRKSIEIFVTFHLVCIGWLLFRSESLMQAGDLMRTIIEVPTIGANALTSFANLFGYLWVLILMQIIQVFRNNLLVLEKAPIPLKAVTYGVLFYLVTIHGGFSNSFIYFQF
jgi:D-alanyl-lipoteichoic acid acyltransferase DltB (MBOAT superfamily)